MGSIAGAAAVAAALALAAAGSGQTTYAAFSDFATVPATVGAGVWAPDPPAKCGDLSKYKGGVVYGTEGDDVLYGGNQSQIIMGLAGNDVLYGGNSGDCLVGGAGQDRLIGTNAKDILLGGPGDDYLDGGNGKDEMDGGGDPGDECVGGNGQNTIVNCDGTSATPAPAATSSEDAPLTDSEVALLPEPPADAGTDQAQPAGEADPGPTEPAPAAEPPADAGPQVEPQEAPPAEAPAASDGASATDPPSSTAGCVDEGADPTSISCVAPPASQG